MSDPQQYRHPPVHSNHPVIIMKFDGVDFFQREKHTKSKNEVHALLSTYNFASVENWNILN
jgi:hypothetical protein